jgi:hypothetical protein
MLGSLVQLPGFTEVTQSWNKTPPLLVPLEEMPPLKKPKVENAPRLPDNVNYAALARQTPPPKLKTLEGMPVQPTCLQNDPARTQPNFADLIICAADEFCTFAKSSNVSAIRVYKECAKLIDFVLNELERAGKDLDDCPGILEPVNADTLRKSIRDKLTEVFLRQAEAPPYQIPPGEALTLDRANADVRRIQRHFDAFVYFGEGYGPEFLDACREAHQAQLRRTQERCAELKGEQLQLLHNPAPSQLSQIHESLQNKNAPILREEEFSCGTCRSRRTNRR